MERQLSISTLKNTIVWGDCKDWLPFIPSSSVDLICIDPPFFTQKNYEIIWGNGYENRCFTDRWKGGKEHYIGWMRERLIEAKRILSPTGSIFLHCDYRTNYKLRFLLDQLLGEQNFINEIIWCYTGPGNTPRHFKRKHDTIFFYSKKKFQHKFFNENIRIEYKAKFTKERGLHGKKSINIEDIRKRHEKGKVPEDWWADLSNVSQWRNELIGYKTQKPEALSERIIKATTTKKDLVLDFFGGGGTTAKVAHDLGRRWITGDVSPVACRVMIERLKKAGAKNFEVKQIPKTKEEWHLTDGHKFADTICEFMGWESNPKKSGDGGIDGWANKGKVAIQIKNHKQSIGRHHIQGFLGSMTGYDEGIFVGWHFSPKAWDYVHIAQRDFGKKIQLFPAHQILGELVLTADQREKYQALYEKAIKAAKYAPPPIEMVS